MKLLLTSNGLSNDTIARALEDLTGKRPQDVKIAFIITAANPERSDKAWLINDLYRLHTYGYYVDIIDLPALSREALARVLEEADVIFVGGGNTFYLSYWMQKSGMFEMLPELLKTKVYAGISAGSMIAGQSLTLGPQTPGNIAIFKDEDYYLTGSPDESSKKTVQLVSLILRPHFNSVYFSAVRTDALEQKAKSVDWPVYALDDNSALKIIDDEIEVVSEGEWEVFRTRY